MNLGQFIVASALLPNHLLQTFASCDGGWEIVCRDHNDHPTTGPSFISCTALFQIQMIVPLWSV